MAKGPPISHAQKTPQIHVALTRGERDRLELFCHDKGHSITWTVREGLRLLYAQQRFG